MKDTPIDVSKMPSDKILEMISHAPEQVLWAKKFLPKGDVVAMQFALGHAFAGEVLRLRQELSSLQSATLPRVGAIYWWEPTGSARELVVVEAVEQRPGDGWWIKSRKNKKDEGCWNSLWRWVEATVLTDLKEIGDDDE